MRLSTGKRLPLRFLAGLLLSGLSILWNPLSLHALDIEEIYSRPSRIEVDEENGLTLSIQNADIQSVLKALAQKKGLNIVTSPDVTGSISVHLHDAPLQEALDAVITLNGFNYSRKGDIIFVTKGKTDSERNLSGTEVRAFKLNYVDVEEMEKSVKDIVSSSAMVTAYKPEKTLIVEDMPHYLDRVQKVLKKIDIPPKQVLIEAKIMEIRLTDNTSLGIDWQYFFSHTETSGEISSFGFADPGSQGLFFTSSDKDFTVILDALQTQSDVNTLSTPKLVALDKQEAKIIVGEKLGYFIATTNDGTTFQSVEFLETGTQLNITPYIMDDGNIVMEIHPEVSDGVVVAGLPSETTTEVKTTLIARNGGTIFIGGLIRDRKEDIRDQVPFLGSLPLIGVLFGGSTHTTQKTEIVVLITPHIISPAKSDRFAGETEKIDSRKQYLDQERSLMEFVPGFK